MASMVHMQYMIVMMHRNFSLLFLADLFIYFFTLMSLSYCLSLGECSHDLKKRFLLFLYFFLPWHFLKSTSCVSNSEGEI